MSTSQQVTKLKRIVWTGAIASVTVVGTIYGAGLKTQGEQKQQIRKVREAPISERIAHLEEQRGVLVGKRMGLQKKIEESQMRRNGATVEESTRGMERKRGENVGLTMEGERKTTRVDMEDNLRVVGVETEIEEGKRGRERKRTWW
ncbi:hypothetical protein BOTNAR_0119g00190 [Botryotinia narcissicola]|uniref:Uncharacterized protein n=1 Tax=Botryotinia narcissicola TaxID=278944 RepID=A0A4Z1IL64_9HELO|nr:hypothetical protein BOTNAR_0119g00190 [Botryotinia narcissicola]